MPTTPLRSYVYPNEFDDNWYNTFQSMLLAIDADVGALVGGANPGDLISLKSTPALRLAGTEVGAVEFRIVESAGTLYFQRNSGSFAYPVWVSLMALTQQGDLQFFQAGRGGAYLSPNGNVTQRLTLDNDGATLVTNYP